MFLVAGDSFVQTNHILYIKINENNSVTVVFVGKHKRLFEGADAEQFLLGFNRLLDQQEE